MKLHYRYLCLFYLLAIIIGSCSRYGDNIDNDDETITDSSEFRLYSISFIGDPIHILSTNDQEVTSVDNRTMGYFNIVKVKDNLYYLYYIAVGKDEVLSDDSYDLCIAISSDGFNWKRGTPEGKHVIMQGVIEQSVFIVPDDDFPFRLIGNERIDNVFTLCMWKSKDGITFVNRKIMMTDRWHDTQNTGVYQNGKIKLYTRLWNATATNRQNGVAYFDLEGNQLTSLQKLAGDYLYNAAPLSIDERYEILLPTFYNNREGINDECHVKAYLVDGLFVKEIECGLNEKLQKDTGWVLVSPYLIDIGGKNYISFHTSTATHDGDFANARIDYWLLEVEIKRENL